MDIGHSQQFSHTVQALFQIEVARHLSSDDRSGVKTEKEREKLLMWQTHRGSFDGSRQAKQICCTLLIKRNRFLFQQQQESSKLLIHGLGLWSPAPPLACLLNGFEVLGKTLRHCSISVCSNDSGWHSLYKC